MPDPLSKGYIRESNETNGTGCEGLGNELNCSGLICDVGFVSINNDTGITALCSTNGGEYVLHGCVEGIAFV